MKNRFLIVLLCAFSATSYLLANDGLYFPEGMKWVRDSWAQEGATVHHSINSCIVQGDTLINGKTYRNVTQENIHFVLPIRQEEKKIYAHLNDSDYLLCDFGLKVGDVIPAYDGYDPNIGLISYPDLESNRVALIDSVTLLDGRIAKRFFYDYRPMDIEYVTCPIWRVLDPMYGSICMCSDQGELLCCSYNGEQVYEFNEGDCNKLENMESKDAIDNTSSENLPATKALRDGQLYIIRDGRTYNAQGMRAE